MNLLILIFVCKERTKVKVYVEMLVNGYYSCEIEVSEINEMAIREAASQKFTEANFGELYDVDGEFTSFYTDEEK